MTVLGRNPLFFFLVSFTWNFMKLAVWFQFFWLKKWNWLWFHYFKGLKLWNRQSQSGTKWNWRPRRSRVPSVSFFSRRRVPSVSFCFPTDLWRFHKFMPLKIMKPSASFFFDAKKIWNQYRQFHPVFAWNLSKIKIQKIKMVSSETSFFS